MENCPCGTGTPYQECCQPFIDGTTKAVTAVQVMRSRYTAYAKTELEYLFETTSMTRRDQYDRETTEKWAKNSEWLGLDILATNAGGPDDEKGTVEFIAHFVENGVRRDHHEISSFVKEDGAWRFHTGKVIQKPIQKSEKIGRNDPCSCGSGLKYKKCCGKK